MKLGNNIGHADKISENLSFTVDFFLKGVANKIDFDVYCKIKLPLRTVLYARIKREIRSFQNRAEYNKFYIHHETRL
jgi:hypothetical protein